MSFISTVAPAEAAGEVREMYERQQAAWGHVPNYARIFSHRPEVLARWGRLLAEIRRPMDARRFELVTFAAAHTLKHTACSLAHGHQLKKFLGESDVCALARGDDSEKLTVAEREMMAFARKIAADASQITEADVEALRAQGFDDAEIFDIAATAAGRAFFTKLLDSLGVKADSTFLEMSDEFREAMTLGNGIDTEPVERLPL